MRIKDKWTDYFKKPKEKMTVRNQHDVAAFLEESFTHTSQQLKYKGVWTDYFKKQKPQLRNPITSQHDVAAFLEYSVTHTADEKRYKGVWTDYFKRWRRDEEDPKRNAFNLEAFLEVPYIVNPLGYMFDLEDDPYALCLTPDGNTLFVGLSRSYSTYHLVALAYSNGVSFLAFHGDDSTSISLIDVGTNFVLTHEITNDVSDSVFCLYSRSGYNVEKIATSSSHADGWRMGVWLSDDKFVAGDLYRRLYLFDTSGGAFTQLDSLDLGQYPYGTNYISVYEDYIAVAQASSWANPTSKGVGLYKVVGDELQFCDSELPGNEINQAYCAAFNYTGEYIVVTTDWKIVLLKREGNSLTVLQSLDKADVISSGAYCYEAAFSPVANYIAFADSWYPTQYIWKIENDQLVFVKTIENNVEEYCYTSTLIWSNDGQYVIAGVGGWYPAICVEKIF